MANRIKKTDRKKPWAIRQMNMKPYAVEEREKSKSFLIICEGVNTEPEYFKAFPLGNADVTSFGTGSTKTALVEQALLIIAKDEDAKLKEIWVVFDFDVKPDQVEQQKEDYNRAIGLAHSKGLHVAYSNDAFELWFLLHYQYLDAQWSRHQYYEKLSDLWNCNYVTDAKGTDFCRKIYSLLEKDENADQAEALNRARKLHEKMSALPYADRNPCTLVYRLVEELNQYL